MVPPAERKAFALICQVMDDDSLRDLLNEGTFTVKVNTIYGPRFYTVKETGGVLGYCSHAFGLRRTVRDALNGWQPDPLSGIEKALSQYLCLRFAPKQWHGNRM